MTFVNHGVAGGLLYMWIAWLFRERDKWTIIGIGAAGFLIGAAPDIVGWMGWGPLGDGGWQLRNLLHDGWVNDYLQWTLAWGLHTWLDRFIHPYPDYVLEYQLFEAATWVVYAFFGWVLYRSYRDAVL